MLEKKMYPFFRASIKWIDHRRIPLTKKVAKEQKITDNIDILFLLPYL